MLDIPAAGVHLWDLYQNINKRLRRVIDRQAVPLSFSELSGCISLTGIILNKKEIEIIFEMDDAFCETVNLELKDLAEREKEEQEKNRGRRK